MFGIYCRQAFARSDDDKTKRMTKTRALVSANVKWMTNIDQTTCGPAIDTANRYRYRLSAPVITTAVSQPFIVEYTDTETCMHSGLGIPISAC
jgi:hypothetical protein